MSKLQAYIRRRESARRREITKTIALATLLLSSPLLFFGLYNIFEKIDCATATNNLEFIEDCLTADNCTLKEYELARIEGYTRLKLARCPRQ
jgi:hypothetical protein